MVPFSSMNFYVLAALFLAVAFACKHFTSKLVAFHKLLFVGTILFIAGYSGQAIKAVSFVTYSYLVYFLLHFVFRVRHKLVGAALLALPMIAVKASFFVDRLQFIGLSYVTFRVIQIYIDSDNRQMPVNILDFVVFLLFPPTLLIGPIDRFQRFRDDLHAGYQNLNKEWLFQGWQLLIHGIVLKFVLAVVVSTYWLSRANQESFAVKDMANNMYAYSFYLYFDFAGYSALAVGLGYMFGIAVPENFNHPFLAQNPQEFWRRWHITLSNWLRDYVFRPYYVSVSRIKWLGRYPLLRQNSGLFLTFFVMGLWNGFHSAYILSGSLFGFYLVVHNTYLHMCRAAGRDVVFGTMPSSLVKAVSVFITFNLSCLALYIFSGRCPFIPME
jgi:membrane protein involved in D-alanine export